MPSHGIPQIPTGCPVELVVTLLKSAFEQSGASLLLLEERSRIFLVIDGLVDAVTVGVVVLVDTF